MPRTLSGPGAPIVANGAAALARSPEYKALAASIRAEVEAGYAGRLAEAGPLGRLWLPPASGSPRRRRAVARAVNNRLYPSGALY